jgi:uncharacterized membrane protein SpoIIM required for sporulation
MDERRFIEESRPGWVALTAGLDEARARGVTALRPDELRGLNAGYRRAASDLAYAQTHLPDSETTRYLNALVARAHGELYGSTPRRGGNLLRFFTRDYPALVRAEWRMIGLSALLLFGSIAGAFLLAHVDYPLARVFLPPQLRDTIADRFESGQGTQDIAGAVAPLMTAQITVNNIQVALTAFAGGMTFGAVTAYALLQNGLLLGVLAGVYSKAGLSLPFLALIVPHGALELAAIVIAGGAGLMLARSLVAPGDLPRLESLRRAVGPAVRLVLGTIPLFIVAGVIEGFITPRDIDPWLRIGFGLAMLGLFAAYVLLAGRGAGRRPARDG